MALARLSPEAPPPSQPDLPVTEAVTVQTVAIRNDKTPIGSLQAYLDGLPWTVTYYGQVLSKDNNLKELDPQLSAVHQQYQKTTDLEIRVQSTLQASYDNETHITNVTGSALISHLTPNKNDYFVAEASLQHEGLFVITNVERRTHRQGSVYLVDYLLVGYIGSDQGLYENLESKVVRKYRFSKERMVSGLAPMLKEEVHGALEAIEQHYAEIVTTYFQRFFNRSFMTLVVPGQATSVYDVWLVEFLAAVMDSQDVEEWRDMRMMSLEHDRYIKQGSFWKALVSRSASDLQRVHHKAGVVSRSVFNQSSWLHGPRYWSMQSYIYPIVTSDDVRLGTERPIPSYPLQDLTGDTEAVYQVVTVGDSSFPLIKPVLTDDYYVLSEAFYINEGVLSALEIQVRDYLNHKTLSLDLMEQLIADYPNWPVLEQFYYGPILALLCKEAPRGFYK